MKIFVDENKYKIMAKEMDCYFGYSILTYDSMENWHLAR